MQLRLSCAFCALLLSSPVLACTPEQATAKAEELAAKVAQVTEQDPERAARLHQKIEERGVETQADDLRNDCEAYEQRLRELDEFDRQQ
jgi:hypothetical protein